jgi:hypothetical protein
MRRVLFSFVPVAALVLQPALAHADGSAPIRFRHSGAGPAVYFCVDNTGRGAPNNKMMQDGRPGTLLAPGTTVRAPDTNLFDRPTLRIYNTDGVGIYSKTLLLIPLGGERWEQLWDGTKLVPDNR